MANVSYDELFPLLAPHLPGAPNATMRFHLAGAAADFLASTHLWRETLYSQTTVADQATYFVTGSGVVESVLWLKLDDLTLAQTDPRLLNKSLLDAVGKPARFWIIADSEVRLHPTPDAAYELTGEIAVKPARDATSIPDWIYETWADAIVDGAIWRISSIPGKSWSDMGLATLHKQRFDRAKANAMTRDYRQIDLRVQPRMF